MSALLTRLRDLAEELRASRDPESDGTATRRLHRADARARAICPVDSLAFTPLYTEGRCPLCGWTPDGYVYAPPPLARYERYWGAMGGILAASVLMCVIVVIAYTRV